MDALAPTPGPDGPDPVGRDANRFAPELMYAAATQYYLEDVTQAGVAERLGVSRATVSRILTEARRQGIVTISVHRPDGYERLAAEVADALGLHAVYVVPEVQGTQLGPWLSPGVTRALTGVGLEPGDVLLVSSGRTVYECALEERTRLPGVVIAPAVGGQEDPQPWFQTNETTRVLAERTGARPSYLYAPALPGRELFESLHRDPTFQRITTLWTRARCALVGVGSAPLTRTSLPSFVPSDAPSLQRAVGDVCSRFYDRDGQPVDYPGSERIVATGLDDLRHIPDTIAVAVGEDKVRSIVAAARGRYFTQLVTDAATATRLVQQAPRH
ncbi:MAG: sugar-binding domain-containing protein [Nocardioidaceae bacterium]|nr:sugar-binding domain-containing protein [Nocardioidaceae bacterium]